MPRTPDDIKKAQVWVTKDGEELDFEFYIPGGPKGVPGGLTAAIPLYGSPDLNTVTTPGTYRNMDNLNATTALNFPLGGVAGNIIVIATDPGIVTQILYPINGAYSSRAMWVRTFNSTWHPWRAFNTTRIDNTVGKAIYQWDDTLSREQLIYGDTGSRGVGTVLVNGWTATAANEVTLRRVGQTVFFNAKANNTAATTDTIYVLPAGFRPRTNGTMVISGATSGGVARFSSVGSAGSISQYRTTTGEVLFSGTWSTLEAWPATLPGVADGAIPNL